MKIYENIWKLLIFFFCKSIGVQSLLFNSAPPSVKPLFQSVHLKQYRRLNFHFAITKSIQNQHCRENVQTVSSFNVVMYLSIGGDKPLFDYSVITQHQAVRWRCRPYLALLLEEFCLMWGKHQVWIHILYIFNKHLKPLSRYIYTESYEAIITFSRISKALLVLTHFAYFPDGWSRRVLSLCTVAANVHATHLIWRRLFFEKVTILVGLESTPHLIQLFHLYYQIFKKWLYTSCIWLELRSISLTHSQKSKQVWLWLVLDKSSRPRSNLTYFLC